MWVRSVRACRRVWFVHACRWVWCGCGVCMLVGGYGVGVVCACLLVGMGWVQGVHACWCEWCRCVFAC